MRIIRVTAPLGPFFDKDAIPPHVLEMASARGTEVHAACAAYARGLPVFVSDAARPYFESFKMWFDRYVVKVLFVEAEFSDPTCYGITGHPDIVCVLVDGRVVVVDYKTPAAESKTWRAQVACYAYLVRPVVGKVEGLALMLRNDGGPAKAIVYRHQASDFAGYLAALQAWRHFKEAA